MSDNTDSDDGEQISDNICRTAAENNDFELLKKEHENGCTLDKDICRIAVKNNNFRMFEYAHKNGFACIASSCFATIFIITNIKFYFCRMSYFAKIKTAVIFTSRDAKN